MQFHLAELDGSGASLLEHELSVFVDFDFSASEHIAPAFTILIDFKLNKSHVVITGTGACFEFNHPEVAGLAPGGDSARGHLFQNFTQFRLALFFHEFSPYFFGNIS